MPPHTRSSFLNAIAASPDDDAHRLVFADWLDENGDPDRAEFIRAQCELAALPPGDPRRVPLGIREVLLRQQHAHEWIAELPKWARDREVQFRRGMPASLRCTKKEYLRNASALAKRTAVEGLSFRISDGTLTELTGLTQLSRIREFKTITDSLPEQHHFLSSPNLTGLRRLDLYDPRADIELIRLPAVQGLREFDLRWGRTENARPGRDALFDCAFPALRSLTISSGIDTTAEVRALLAAPFLPRLDVLKVLIAITPECADLWAGASGRTAGPRSLSLYPNATDHALPRFLRECRLPGLYELRLDYANDETAHALVESPTAGQLTRLSLLHTRGLTRAGVGALASSGRLAGLRRLALSPGFIDDDAVRELAAGTGLPNLQRLDLVGTQVTPVGLEALVRSPHLPALAAINVPWSLAPKENRATAELTARSGNRIAIFHDEVRDD